MPSCAPSPSVFPADCLIENAHTLQAPRLIQNQQLFFEEIDFTTIEIYDHVGHGAFGIVHRGFWNGQVVAVKKIDNANEREAFLIELKQLSRVRHENIVKLYGACTKNPVCLVMEYAEGGSVDKVLHETKPPPIYKAAHAFSWALQCARGVEYLHNMKPKALVHRDLKPHNLLLIDLGRKLKICDFGTVCDLHTCMTSNKGSAAYMAPEVFKGSSYTEKCDVYSWGIVLWQIITRARPFEQYDNQFRLFWEVQDGVRPYPIQNCPKPITVLLENCWEHNPDLRPSMTNIVERMKYLLQFFSGADEPLVYPEPDESANLGFSNRPTVVSDFYPSPYQNETGSSATEYSGGCTRLGDSEGVLVPILMPTYTSLKSQTVKEDLLSSFQSAPASLACSQETLNYFPSDLKNFLSPENQVPSTSETPAPFKKGHRRNASWEVGAMKVLNKATADLKISIPAKKLPVNHSFSSSSAQNFAPLHLELPSEPPNGIHFPVHGNFGHFTSPYAYLEEDLQPVEPIKNCPESIEIYEDHCRLADEYLKTRAEIALLMEKKRNLIRCLENQEKSIDDHQKLKTERDQLLELRNSLKEQVEKLRR